MSRPVFIYTLTDPRTSQIRYVGKTVDIEGRMRQHNSRMSSPITHRDYWGNSLLDSGQKPVFTVIDVANENNWEDIERFWISYHRNNGFPLTNLSSGGEGAGLGNKNGVGNPGCIRQGWGNGFDCCQDCGTTERPHKARGRCNACYLKVIRAERPRVRPSRAAGVPREEWNEKISEGLKLAYAEGRRVAEPRSEETKQKISETKKAQNRAKLEDTL